MNMNEMKVGKTRKHRNIIYYSPNISNNCDFLFGYYSQMLN